MVTAYKVISGRQSKHNYRMYIVMSFVVTTAHVEWYWRPLGRLALWWWRIPEYGQ